MPAAVTNPVPAPATATGEFGVIVPNICATSRRTVRSPESSQ
jgi:hypothetical protein